MGVDEELRKQAVRALQSATSLNVAFVGVADGLFSALAKRGQASPADLAAMTGLDQGYLVRWCDAAFAFGYIDEADQGFILTELGNAYRPEVPGSLMPFAVRSVLSAHMAERAAELMKTGSWMDSEALEQSSAISPLFGPMLEANFASFFEQHILRKVEAYKRADEKAGLIVDLGCGNGWYLRKLALHFPHIRAVGLDAMEENIRQAEDRAREQGLGHRLRFELGDIHQFKPAEPVAVIAMNRALHHVWAEKERVFGILASSLAQGGSAVIWEPNWPRERADLRDPSRRGMAFQNLTEHLQGNHLLRPEEIEAAFQAVGLITEIHLFAHGNEAVVVGSKTP